MPCASPPELSDTQLLRHIDGHVDAAVVAHLAICASCRQRAGAIARLQHGLAGYLHRLDCPAPGELGEYQLGLLPRQQAASVAAHLIECPHCQGEIAQLQGYLVDLAPDLELGLLERARVLVARLIGGGVASSPLGLAPIGVRGGGDEPYVYEAGDAQIVLTVEADEQPGQHTLLGLVIAAEPHELLAQLWHAEQLVASAPVDAAGNFILPGLGSASYDLVLRRDNLEIYVRDVQV